MNKKALPLLLLILAVFLVKPVFADLIGDFNKDGHVDIDDLVVVVGAFGSHGPPNASSNWNSTYDLNLDNVVDIMDIMIVCQHFGQHV
jgi:hypothetical protein